jgi:hypothetical protein
MSAKPITDLMRERWASARPYSGTATETLRRKLLCGALRHSHDVLVRRELAMRETSV